MILNTRTTFAVEVSVEGVEMAVGVRDPRTADPFRAAELALRAGQPDVAIRLSKQLLESDSSHIGALETLAKALWQTSAYEDLLQTLAKLIRLNPYEPGYHALKGAALQCLGRYGDSIRSFLRGSDSPGARESSIELRNWQAQLVESILSEDPVFRAHYRRDPEEACRARGFEFRSESKIRQWFLSDDSARAALFTRPS
jgi:tetratricopeptide (TPR) repeat protein